MVKCQNNSSQLWINGVNQYRIETYVYTKYEIFIASGTNIKYMETTCNKTWRTTNRTNTNRTRQRACTQDNTRQNENIGINSDRLPNKDPIWWLMTVDIGWKIIETLWCSLVQTSTGICWAHSPAIICHAPTASRHLATHGGGPTKGRSWLWLDGDMWIFLRIS